MKNEQTELRPAGTAEADRGFRRSPTLALADEIQGARKAGQDVLSLSTPSFPQTASVALADLSLGMRLSLPEGDPALRIAARAGLFGRWVLPDHDVIITAGAKAALFTLLRILPGSGARIIVVAPAWPSYDDIIRLAGHVPVPLSTRFRDGFRLDATVLARHLAETGARAVFLANPGNPTGRIVSGADLDPALAVCAEFGALLVLDESFSEIVADKGAWATAITRSDPVLTVINSFSKNHHLQGQRVAACLLHASLREDFLAVHQTLMSSAPSLGQAAALAALRVDAALDYSASRSIAAEIIRRAGWPCLPNQGTFYHFPRLPDPARTLAMLREVGLYALTGDVFGAPYADHLRLCFGRPETEMAEIQTRIGAAGLLMKA